MTGISEKELSFINQISNHDFDLGIVGFKYSDLFDAVRLRELAEKFYDDLKEENALLHEALTKYIEKRGRRLRKTRRIEYPDRFRAVSFALYRQNVWHYTRTRINSNAKFSEQDPIWKYKFFVQRRAIKKFPAEKIVALNEIELTEALERIKIRRV